MVVDFKNRRGAEYAENGAEIFNGE